MTDLDFDRHETRTANLTTEDWATILTTLTVTNEGYDDGSYLNERLDEIIARLNGDVGLTEEDLESYRCYLRDNPAVPYEGEDSDDDDADESKILEVHLTTDAATGELTIDFDPKREKDHLPGTISEWVEIRRKLRERVGEQIAPESTWERYLDSNRGGERLDAHIGDIIVTDDGFVRALVLNKTDPEYIDW